MQQIMFTGIITSAPTTYKVPIDQQGEWAPDLTFCQFYVAAGRLKRRGKRKTDYFSVKAYNKRGEFVQTYGHKGMKVYVQGELQAEQIERPNGSLDILLAVRASSVEFLGMRSDINETILSVSDEGQEDYIDIADDLVGW